MKRVVATAAVLAALAAPAFANSCPKHMAAIDAALAKNPQLSDAQMSEVKKYRAEGEALHKSGKHAESEATLAKAEKILGIQ
jgi:Tfp pilus assembly protein PilE